MQATHTAALRRGIALEWFSIAWMVVEGTVGIVAGIVAHSVSLEAFGVDSGLELISAGVVLWWLLLARRGADPARTHDAQERAERVVGAGLLLLALYVVIASAIQLVTRSKPDTSVPGLALALSAAVVMPMLFVLKRRVATALDSQALRGVMDVN